MKPPNTLYWESVREDWLLIPQSWPRIRTSDILGIQLYTQLTPRRIWISFSECNHVECTVGHIRLPNGHQLYVCVYVHFYICIYIYIWNIYIYTYIYTQSLTAHSQWFEIISLVQALLSIKTFVMAVMLSLMSVAADGSSWQNHKALTDYGKYP